MKQKNVHRHYYPADKFLFVRIEEPEEVNSNTVNQDPKKPKKKPAAKRRRRRRGDI